MAIKCTDLIYKPVNALTIRLSGGTKSLIPHTVNNKIISLESPDGIITSTDSIMDIKKFKYKINIIEQITRQGVLYYDLSTAKRTKSSTFILPMLGGKRRLFFWNTLLMNAFVGIEDKKDCIVLLYKFSMDPLFLKFEKAIKTFNNFLEKIDIDPYHVLFIFNIPKIHVKNYNKLKQGKYSELDEDYKLDILEFHDFSFKKGQVAQVLWKSEKRRKAMEKALNADIDPESELLTAIDFDKEIYDLEIYEIKKQLKI
tara:strand:+ start:946 stop:1713 length:768 start_codon:yes stop_codon:yes gene_type:complete